MDELAARHSDLVQKIERDIAEGSYLLATALPALIDVTVFQLLECDDPEGALRRFVADLLVQFDFVLDTLDEEP